MKKYILIFNALIVGAILLRIRIPVQTLYWIISGEIVLYAMTLFVSETMFRTRQAILVMRDNRMSAQIKIDQAQKQIDDKREQDRREEKRRLRREASANRRKALLRAEALLEQSREVERLLHEKNQALQRELSELSKYYK
jgi:hypothetical protein